MMSLSHDQTKHKNAIEFNVLPMASLSRDQKEHTNAIELNIMQYVRLQYVRLRSKCAACNVVLYLPTFHWSVSWLQSNSL